jgi:hypothetical protein
MDNTGLPHGVTDTSALPDDYTQLVRISLLDKPKLIFLTLFVSFFQYTLAVSAVNKLTAVYGTQYTIGSSTNVLCKENFF